MRIIVYVQEDGTQDGRCSLVPLDGVPQRKLAMNVPPGSRLAGEGEFTFLVTPDGRAHSPRDLRVYCWSGIDGYSFVDDSDEPSLPSH